LNLTVIHSNKTVSRQRICINPFTVKKTRHQNEKLLALVLEATQDGLWVWYIPSGKAYFSPRFYSMLGYEPDELPAYYATWASLLHPDDLEKTQEIVEKHIDNESESYEVEFRLQTKSGKWRWVLGRGKVVEWDDDGQSICLVGSHTDIDARKRADQKLAEYKERLLQAQKMESLGTLAGGIAHDFNNLLMGIQGRVSLMAVDMDPESRHLEHLKAIEKYIQSATDLTKRLLDLSRRGKLEFKAIDLKELVLDSAAMFGRTRKELQIHTKTIPGPLIVAADKRQIEQVLLNIYINAWQAMPNGGELYLETKIVNLDDADCKPYKSRPGRYAEVSVTDTGIGMSNVTLQRIFDPFFTTKKKGRGTGLGLASAYDIVKNHSGFISVCSEVGKGTTFNIYLPVSDKELHQHLPARNVLVKGSDTVLLVDDEEMVLYVCKAMLENMGYLVIAARSGEQAVDAVRRKSHEIDLVILDMVMPGMDGGKTLGRIRKIQPGIPVILASGYAFNGKATKTMKRGCNGFIQKPFNFSELSQKVREILDGAKGFVQK
jgi:PAS domain S-box-containing protein